MKHVLFFSLFLAASTAVALAGSSASSGYKVEPQLPGTYIPLPPARDTPTQGEFFRCGMAQCLRPRVNDPRGGVGDPGEAAFADRRFSIIRMIEVQCGGQPSRARANACAMQVCAQNAPHGLTPAQLGQYCSTLAGAALH